ncbi:hypothetical protein PDESU_04498 [Pontiella desulfatans]|uniref:Uncharacterized protein n=1 Tax=Pontiella desulfatans TaxID=2750659 RepID=A0A6C2U7B6_PONDE|nr:hypothetical protein PDESU_04498 [Pontiella desulfatans]
MPKRAEIRALEEISEYCNQGIERKRPITTRTVIQEDDLPDKHKRLLDNFRVMDEMPF